MTGQQKKYVFRELVQDRRNVIDLISYAIYKSHKDERAEHFASLYPPTNVTQKLQEWHDGVACDPTALGTYRQRSLELVSALEAEATKLAKFDADNKYEQSTLDLKAEHQRELQTLEDAHRIETDELKQRILDADAKSQKEWTDKIAAWTINETQPPWYWRWLKNGAAWIGAGISGLLATVFSTMIIVGAFGLISSDARNLTRSALKGAIDTFIPEKPVDMSLDSSPVTQAEKTKL
ncbi:hypothetical protein [Pectobacterium versatile]|uniref:hypothetical protein n=1 Tax=Pectobacterium versatile TaxID=2488639 RepID=UPI002B24BEA3|nr:hypothetical protein [Pectobacterium versatile]